MAGYDVLLLQERLAELSYYDGPLDGIYSVELARAVASFQEDHQLEVDGEVGPLTWAALGGKVLKHCRLPEIKRRKFPGGNQY